jgi:hypothetical protein
MPDQAGTVRWCRSRWPGPAGFRPRSARQSCRGNVGASGGAWLPVGVVPAAARAGVSGSREPGGAALPSHATSWRPCISPRQVGNPVKARVVSSGRPGRQRDR